MLRWIFTAVTLIASQCVYAQDDKVYRFGDWRVKCGAQEVQGCYMSMLGKHPDSGEAIYRVGVRYEEYYGKNQMLLKVLVPLGVSLMQAPVLSIAIDRPSGPKSFVLDYTRCVDVGCLAVNILSPELEDLLTNGHTGTLMFVDGSGQIHKYSFSLKGSSKSIAMVQDSH
jgi:invasion protein IalB